MKKAFRLEKHIGHTGAPDGPRQTDLSPTAKKASSPICLMGCQHRHERHQ